MSHPVPGATLPSGRCDCGHLAPVGEIITCTRPGCGCTRHVAHGPRGGYDPLTPPGAEAALDDFKGALEEATTDLVAARNAELEAEETRDEARRRAQLSPECPKVGVFDGVRTTVAYQQAWIEDRIKDEERAYRIARTARQAASDHFRKVSKQGSFQQSITGSVREQYRGQRGDAW